MMKGQAVVNLATAVIEARQHLNEMMTLHGPDSILTQRAAVQLRNSQRAATDYMS